MKILPTPKVTVYSNELQIHTVFLLSEAYFFSARLLYHEKYGMRHQYMKLYFVNFIYFGPRKEVNLDFSLSIIIPILHLLYIIAFLYLSFSFASKKEEYFWKNTVGTWEYILEKILQKRICMGWDSWLHLWGRYWICNQFLLFCFLAGCLRGVAHWICYMVCFLTSTSPSLPKCHVRSSSLFNVFCMSFLLSPTEEGPCDTVLLQGQSP